MYVPYQALVPRDTSAAISNKIMGAEPPKISRKRALDKAISRASINSNGLVCNIIGLNLSQHEDISEANDNMNELPVLSEEEQVKYKNFWGRFKSKSSSCLGNICMWGL